jgi:hypothetical protein
MKFLGFAVVALTITLGTFSPSLAADPTDARKCVDTNTQPGRENSRYGNRGYAYVVMKNKCSKTINVEFKWKGNMMFSTQPWPCDYPAIKLKIRAGEYAQSNETSCSNFDVDAEYAN